MHNDKGTSKVQEFKYYVTIQWDSNAIGEIAKAEGFDKVYYADLETFSILGIYTTKTVRVYGE